MRSLSPRPIGTARHLGRAGRRRYPAMTGTDGFRRCVQPSSTLIKRGTNSLIPDTDSALIDHEHTIGGAHRVGESPTSPLPDPIRLLLGVALVPLCIKVEVRTPWSEQKAGIADFRVAPRGRRSGETLA